MSSRTLYILTVLRDGDTTMGKDYFDPGQNSGVQRFVTVDKVWYQICFYGSALTDVKIGNRVFFQNYRGTYWLGTIERDCFLLVSNVPFENVQDGVSLVESEERMIREHASGWFVEQGELPF